MGGEGGVLSASSPMTSSLSPSPSSPSSPFSYPGQGNISSSEELKEIIQKTRGGGRREEGGEGREGEEGSISSSASMNDFYVGSCFFSFSFLFLFFSFLFFSFLFFSFLFSFLFSSELSFS